MNTCDYYYELTDEDYLDYEVACLRRDAWAAGLGLHDSHVRSFYSTLDIPF